MVDKKLKGLTASKLRLALFASMALILIAGGAGFWFMRNTLVAFANEVRSTTTQASTTSNDIVKLEGIKKALKNEEVAVTRASNILADTESYVYQEQLIEDLTIYSKLAGVRIISITFNTETGAGGAAPPAEGAQTQGPLKKISITVNMTTPTKYLNVMQFLRYIEYSMPKMQVMGVSFTNSASGTEELKLIVPSFEIEVYTK